MKTPHLFRALASILLLNSTPAHAVTLGSQPSPTVTPGSQNNFFLDWQGIAGRTYFMQCSIDMQNWDYAPDVWLGNGLPLAYEIQSLNAQVFARLKYTDIPVTNPGEADYDQDGYTTAYELANGMDPLVFDAGGNLANPIGSTPVPASTTPVAGAAFQLIVKTVKDFQSSVKTIDLDENLRAIAVDGVPVVNGFPVPLASHSQNGPFRITVFLIRAAGAAPEDTKLQLVEYQDYIEAFAPHNWIKKMEVHPPLILSSAQGNPHFEITEEFVPYWYIRDLLPVEVRVRQDEGHTGPHGSKSLYQTPRPENGNIKGEVFSLWEDEEAYVTIGGALGDMIENGNLPANSVKWSAPDHTDVTDKKEFKVEWATKGQREVKLELFGSEHLIHFTVPDVGVMGRTNVVLVQFIGITDLGYIWGAGQSARDVVDAKYGTTGATGGTRQDAIRHSTWNAVVAHRLGLNRTIMATTANEYTGKMDAKAIASNATMDLNNNYEGALKGYLQMGQPLTLQQFMDQLEAAYNAGNSLIKWIPDANTVEAHHGMLRWSDGKKLFDN